ncbi:MAG: autotransporter outer membrane beta-barrel domain-containing protein, partial [Legionellales bacterium]
GMLLVNPYFYILKITPTLLVYLGGLRLLSYIKFFNPSKRNLGVKKKHIIVMSLISSLICGQAVHANSTKEPQNNGLNDKTEPGLLKQIKPELLYSYVDFNFNSTQDTNYNRFQGYSNIAAVGADNITLRKDLLAGLYYFNVTTSFNSQSLLMPFTVNQSQQTINNNTIFGHVLKTFNPNWYMDLAGGYGQNKLTLLTATQTPLPFEANTHNDNWFVSLNALYRKTWTDFILKANVGAFYSQINTGPYQFVAIDQSLSQPVPALVNKATLIMENAELGYNLNPELVPFINGGLIQVAQFSNSRPVVSAVINGSLPQLNLNKNGFRLGAGITFKHKQLSLRLEEKYYNSAGTFISYQTFLGLEYQFT